MITPSSSTFFQNGSKRESEISTLPHVGAELRAAEAEVLHAVLELCGRHRSVLHRHVPSATKRSGCDATISASRSLMTREVLRPSSGSIR